MSDFRFYPFDSPEYAADFQTLLRCFHEPQLDPFLDELTRPYPKDGVAADWGARSGNLTARLLTRVATVYAVEPHADLRAHLARNCPAARIVPATIAEASLPQLVDVGILRHVLYHVPDEAWGETVLTAARPLSPIGVLSVMLKHPDTACNRMIEAFGGRRFDLTILEDTFRQHPEFRSERLVLPSPIQTRTFDETLAIARFMLCDRPAVSYRRRFTEEEVEEYVRRHLWDSAEGKGGWACDTLVYCIRLNRYCT